MKRLLTSTAAILFAGAVHAGDMNTDKAAEADSELGYGGASVMTGGTDNGQNLNEVEEELAEDEGERGYGGSSILTGEEPNEDEVFKGTPPGDTEHAEPGVSAGADNS